jgi:GINS complex subunit 1
VDLDLLQDMEPPKNIFIEIIVLEEVGTIVTDSGNVLNLHKNSTMLVRKSDVEGLIRQHLVMPTANA